jgi:hypothetical protein
MIFRATDLGRIKSVATIQAISTHRQQGEAARTMADVPPNLIRLNIGGEHPDDISATSTKPWPLHEYLSRMSIHKIIFHILTWIRFSLY